MPRASSDEKQAELREGFIACLRPLIKTGIKLGMSADQIKTEIRRKMGPDLKAQLESGQMPADCVFEAVKMFETDCMSQVDTVYQELLDAKRRRKAR